VALGVAGAVPGIGLFASAINVMKDTPALLFNIGQTYNSFKSIENLGEYYRNKERLLRKEIEHSSLSDKTMLYEVIDLLLSIITDRIRI
jgi:hypothetical protein